MLKAVPQLTIKLVFSQPKNHNYLILKFQKLVELHKRQEEALK